MIRYTLLPKNPNAHLYAVSIEITPHHQAPLQLTLPAWIPGSYMIRDFARNIVSLTATDQNGPLSIDKQDKQTWLIEHSGHKVVVEYSVYAWDLSVRSAHLDQQHGFFNGTSVFLGVGGQQDWPCQVHIGRPEGEAYAQWKIATGLNRADDTQLFAPGVYLADNYAQLIDCPVEMGTFDHTSFESHGITHYLILTGKHFGDTQRVTRDLKTLCDHHLALFVTPPDIKEYWFLTYITDNGFGGLEHGNSTALICSRFDLPSRNFPDKTDDAYKTFLSLCSHEYFHTWHVKRIKPARFIPYQLAEESYTEQLWAYEGFTSYYDDMSLVRTGLIGIDDYLLLLGKTLSRVQRGKGRFKQSVAESSFDAWSKFYKQDENAPNSVVSYYTKGSLIALCLDLIIRRQTANQHSLDEVMRRLWQQHGQTNIGTEEEDFVAIINSICADQASEFLLAAIHGTDDLPLADLLQAVGVELTYRQATSATDLNGIKETADYTPSLGILSQSAPLGIKVTHVLDDGAAQLGGLSAGDILLAIDQLKVSATSLNTVLEHIPRGTTVTATLFREDALLTLEIDIIEAEAYVAQFKVVDEDKAKQWLSPTQA